MADQAAQPAAQAAPSGYLETIGAAVPLFGAALEAHRNGQMGRARANYLELMDQPWLTAVCLHQLGVLAGQQGDHVKAVDLLRQAIRVDPMQSMYYQNLAAALERIGRRAEAIDVMVDLGVTMQKNNLHAQAVPIYRRVLAVDPCRYAAQVNLGTGLALLGDTKAAADHLIRGVALHGTVLPEARLLLDEIMPELVAAGTVPADAARPPGPPTGRIEMLEHALASLGKALNELGHPDPSLASYRMAVTVEPGLALAHWNLSLALLTRGDFAAGWREYEWRWYWDRFPEPRRRLPAPAWRGEPLAGKRIGVFGEQGYGDIIQFVPLALKLLDEGAEVVLEVPTPLVRLFRLSFESDRLKVTARTDNPHHFETPAPLDYVVPLMSLPHLRRLQLDQLPVAERYIKPLAADVAKWRERFAALPGRKVGIVWAGRAAFADDFKRSMTLEKFKPLFDVPGVSWVSLQVGPRTADLPGAGIRIFDAAPHLDDFADTAAAVSELDQVIAVDTGVAHLAAAIGKPSWILLPRMNDWRWLTARADSPWYPTVRLFRQTEIGDWSTPVAALRQALAG